MYINTFIIQSQEGLQSKYGFSGKLFDEKIYVPAGFNAWRESDGELTIGEVTEMDYFRIEGTDKYSPMDRMQEKEGKVESS